MGVIGTYCQICCVAVQHTHYVRLAGEMHGIYRGADKSKQFEPAVAFGSEHDWLCQAVGLRCSAEVEPAAIFGAVDDGWFEGDDDSRCVGSGREERAALHRCCWDLARKPQIWDRVEGEAGGPDVAPYQGQLFDFAQLIADRKGWMLVDPRLDSPEAQRNRARILKLVQGPCSHA